jgi:Uncharacterised protein family (UPF0149)
VQCPNDGGNSAAALIAISQVLRPIDPLDDYLMSDHAPDDSMGLSDLDGFLTGIVVEPEVILPSEWLPVI